MNIHTIYILFLFPCALYAMDKEQQLIDGKGYEKVELSCTEKLDPTDIESDAIKNYSKIYIYKNHIILSTSLLHWIYDQKLNNNNEN